MKTKMQTSPLGNNPGWSGGLCFECIESGMGESAGGMKQYYYVVTV